MVVVEEERAAKLHRLNTLRLPKFVLKDASQTVRASVDEEKLNDKNVIVIEDVQFDDVDNYKSNLIKMAKGICICDRDIVK